MNNEEHSRRKWSEELPELRQRVAELEAIETESEEKKRLDLESRRKRDKFNALVIAGLPIILGFIILILNRPYFMRFFYPETRACGLPILGIAILLSVAAYPALRKSFSVVETGRQSMGLIFAVLVFTFLVIPAILILLLGPAALLLLTSSLGGIFSDQLIFCCFWN